MRRAARLYIDLVGGGFVVALGVAVMLGAGPDLAVLPRVAPWLAFAVVAEGLVVYQQGREGGGHMSFSATAHVAVALLFGPFVAAVVAATGVVVVDGWRRQPVRHVLINASTFGLSIGLAGIVFQAVGGFSHGQVLDGAALLAMIGVRFVANSALYAGIVVAASGGRFAAFLREELRSSATAGLGEGCLGVLIGLAVIDAHWYSLPFLLPLLAALYQARANYEQLRTETQAVLRTFVEVIDERDPTTARHSERVTEYVERFCDYVSLDEQQRQRLVESARYHDLGKIVVDVATLSKSGRLDEQELAAIRSHPRVSARLLAPFDFAREMARHVELHHERFDGHGYYGVPGDDIPIQAHVLIAADSFDAMTSKRAYRPALAQSEAAEELRAKAGTQFHPLVGRCFAAMIDGVAVEDALSRADMTALRAAFSERKRSPRLRLPRRLPSRRLVAGLATSAASPSGSLNLRTGAASAACRDAAAGAADTIQRPGRTLVVELRAFEALRTAAGQLTAEGVIDDVERRLRAVVGPTAVVARRGDDVFSLTADEKAPLETLCRHVRRAIAQTPVPLRADPIAAHIRVERGPGAGLESAA